MATGSRAAAPRRQWAARDNTQGSSNEKEQIQLLAALAAAFGLRWRRAAAQNFGPPELIAAAKGEGKLVYYTANFAEVEQEVIRAFNKRFPEIKVEMVRAPGGQLITRVKTEAAAGKLAPTWSIIPIAR